MKTRWLRPPERAQHEPDDAVDLERKRVVGKSTRVGWHPDRRIAPGPGRQSLVERELEKWATHEAALHELAPRLGLNAATLDIRVDDDAGRRVASAGASGLADGDVVYLSPERYDPTTTRGRYLLAHELAHVAQRRLAPVAGAATSRAAAEVEAAHIGHAWAGGDAFAAPRMPLPSGAAADTDAEQMAKARPSAQSDFVVKPGEDAFAVSFELSRQFWGGQVRVVVSPTDFAHTKQPLYKYWDVRGREVSKDDSYTTMANVGTEAQPWSQQVAVSLSEAMRFEPVILKETEVAVARKSLEHAAKLWTFDWDGDGTTDCWIRVGYAISNTLHSYDFTIWAKGGAPINVHYAVIPDDAWRYQMGSGIVTPRQEPDDWVDFLGGILTSKTTWEAAITMIPIVGELVLLGEALTGYSIFGDKLSNTERIVSGIAALLPVAGGVIAKGGGDLAKLAAQMGRSEADVMALLKAADKHGAEAATVETWRATLKAGGKLTTDELSALQRMVHQIDADQRVFRAAEEEMSASRILRKGGKVEQTGPISLKRLRNTLGRSGVSPSGYHLRKATKIDLDALRAAGSEPSNVYAWVSRDGSNALAVDAKGRPVITFTDKGLSSLEEAVKSFGHEAKHIKDFSAGMTTSSEALAEQAGEELWELVQKKMGL